MAESEVFDGNGNPVCGDEFCPGHGDCSDCRRLRFLDRQEAERVQSEAEREVRSWIPGVRGAAQ